MPLIVQFNAGATFRVASPSGVSGKAAPKKVVVRQRRFVAAVFTRAGTRQTRRTV